jgi:hypothetical protein
MHPTFLAFVTCMIILICVLGSDQVRPWKVLALLLLGLFGLFASSGAYSILGPCPAVDAAGQFIRDSENHPLYRAHQIAAAEGYMTATIYLSIGSLLAAVIILFSLICTHGFQSAFQLIFKKRKKAEPGAAVNAPRH